MARQTSPLHPKQLRAFRRLRVGPLHLEPQRLVVPYVVTRGRDETQTELVYRYEEDVFDPASRFSQNLASLVAAQVALNYGLFCDEITLQLPLSAADQELLEAMGENTAREIYVKKILQPNPFLVGPAASMKPSKQERYLRAQLRCTSLIDEPSAPRTGPESLTRCAVLSSGGKDSLLSHGLLDEIRCETHPIFINESGRHWHTSLNAFRYFNANVPRTARVWTNADRVFTWMLRQLPFVRPDFAQLRSDEYPIRLWTVAVFLFGALPLVHKRGIGHLVIGDEFDTTARRNHQGIAHYDGLFDQSRYFDNALSRYYRRKGWNLDQFSVLRPLSELLIQKVLIERYPTLQAHQVSCHATHVEADRVRPCGNCEKCRRIVGMLVALDAKPAACGYDDEQVARCLEQLASKKVHQEQVAAEHLMRMLVDRGAVPDGPDLPLRARAHREVLQLRCDREHAPIDGTPRNLRDPLFRILLEHADGAVRRMGKQWLPFDIAHDPSKDAPYSFESPAGALAPAVDQRTSPSTERPPAASSNAPASEPLEPDTAPRREYLLGELSWPLAKQRLAEVDVALLPVGAIEQHGPHLPLDTDAFDANYLVTEVAVACTEPRPLVLPLVPYGVSYNHDDFSGTISVTNSTLRRLVYDVGMSAARNGVAKLVIVNGHGGNAPALQFAAQMINRDARIFTCVDTGETSDTDLARICDTPNDVHAGEIETSTSLANRPHLVDMTLAKRRVPRFSSQYLNFTARRRVEWFARTAKLSSSGVLGDPTKASADKGRQMWAIMIRNLVELVEDLKRLTLNEIYARRY